MTRTLTYVDDVQVSEPTLDAVRDTLHGFHDPSAGNYHRHLREQPSTDADDQQITDENGNDLYEVHIAAEKTGIPDADISTELANFVAAINTALPDDWPTVDDGEVTIK